MLMRKGEADRNPPDQATGRSCRNSGISLATLRKENFAIASCCSTGHTHGQKTKVSHRNPLVKIDVHIKVT